MSFRHTLLFFSLFALTLPAREVEEYPPAKVNYEDYKTLVAEAEVHREKRLVRLDTFLKMSKKPNVIILDARPKFRFDRIHIKGAKHLNFAEFTQASLANIIPSPDTTVLIYCNNNFEGNQVDFRSKVSLPTRRSPLVKERKTSRMMALNVPTYISLYGYGYRNVYELDELVNVKDPRIVFEGTAVTR